MENTKIMNKNNKVGSNLEAQPVLTIIDAAGFWVQVFKLKLNSWGLDESPVPISGYFTPCKSPHNSEILHIDFESLPSETGEPSPSTYSSQGNRNKCLVPGILYNFNTIEGFCDFDRQRLLKEEAEKIWADIQNGKVEEDCAVLWRFLVISFADLKKWTVCYAIAFPTLVLDPPPSLVDLKPASACLSEKEAKSLSAACKEWRSSTTTTGVPFFLVTIASDSHAKLRHLNEWESCQQESQKILFGFYDPCHLRNKPGWPLLNFLAFVHSRWNLATVHFFCYRENRGFPDMGLSLIGEAQISSQEWKVHNKAPGAVGWQIDIKKGKTTSIDLSSYMDLNRRADAAADMNLKLMTWRALPSLNICLLSTMKCLLIGAGTLGCQVARLLMAWGVRKITLLDNGKVAISNPLRQSLYTLNDCGEDKATAAAKSMKSIFPPVDAEGVVMSIPMPGHPVSGPEEGKMLDDCRELQELVNSHDVVFLLTDTRESRWLPTLLCATANKITVNAALGFESFLVMRHGAGPVCSLPEATDALSSKMGNLSMGDEYMGQRLGCYFCNDVVAPIDSTSNRTLDQQCTVTRPGLAPIASALAVELLIALLHHPLRNCAPADIAGSTGSGSSENPLGILPHQIRGSLSEYSQMTLVGHASNSCTACSKIVVSEFQNNGMDFILKAVNHPTYLEDLTGLTELKQAANSFESDWDIEEEADNDGCVEI